MHLHISISFQFGFSGDVAGHARMRIPPGRASMWRDGYPTLEDYNDDECFCGGYTVGKKKAADFEFLIVFFPYPFEYRVLILACRDP